MSESAMTIGDFLGARNGTLTPEQIEMLNTSKPVAAVRRVLDYMPPASLSDLSNSANDALLPVLNRPLGEVIAGLWNDGSTLQEYRDHPKSGPQNLILGEHTIQAEYKPEVAIEVNGNLVPLARIPFTLVLTLDIQGAVLRIRDARLFGAKLGNLVGSGSLTCGEVVLLKREAGDVALKEISYGEGIAII